MRKNRAQKALLQQHVVIEYKKSAYRHIRIICKLKKVNVDVFVMSLVLKYNSLLGRY